MLLLMDYKSPRVSPAQWLSTSCTCLKIWIWIELPRKKIDFIYLSKNEGLSHSCIALSFDRFGFTFMAFCFGFYWVLHSFKKKSDFQLFRAEHHWRVLISRKAHNLHCTKSQSAHNISLSLHALFFILDNEDFFTRVFVTDGEKNNFQIMLFFVLIIMWMVDYCLYL
jgi:hypothetical protein